MNASSDAPAIIVKKGGFFAALATGLFMFLTVTVICVTALGIFALRTVDGKLDLLVNRGSEIVSGLPDWAAKLPPALADCFHDRRDPTYRERLVVAARVGDEDAVDTNRHSRWYGRPIAVRVENRGEQMVTLLGLRLVFKNDAGFPIGERQVYAATPMQIDDEWRGPLAAGQVRELVVWIPTDTPISDVLVEQTDVRVWTPADRPVELPAPATTPA